MVKACSDIVAKDEEDRKDRVKRKHEPVVHALKDKKTIGEVILDILIEQKGHNEGQWATVIHCIFLFIAVSGLCIWPLF